MDNLLKICTRIGPFKKKRDWKERKIFSGEILKSKTEQSSVLFFTIHKAASSYVNRLLRDLLESARFQHIDLERFRFRELGNEVPIRPSHFQSSGFYYGALRVPIELPAGQRAKSIVQVRDPRDVITSFYFSLAYSHKPPKNEKQRQTFEVYREKMAQREIDDFALSGETATLKMLNRYASSLFQQDDVLILHYEDMVNDFDGWLGRVVDYLELPMSRPVQRALKEIKKEANFSIDQEDKFSHKRQVTPGDHRRKLKPETIEGLNREFSSYFQVMRETGHLPLTYQLPDTSFGSVPVSDAA